MMENSNWKGYKIKEIADVIGGGTPRTDNSDFWNGVIPWITPRDLTGYSKMFISKGERLISSEGLKGSSARLLPKGTVLLTSRAPIGYVAIAENEICTNQGFKSLVLNEDLAYNKFIYYWIKNNVDYLQSIGTGTTFAEISGNVIKEIEIKLPPLPEQKAIASVLSSLDDKIDLLRQQNQTLEALAETLFRQWFIEEAKEDWSLVRIGEFVETNSSTVSKGYPHQFINYLDTSSLTEGIISSFQYLSMKEAPSRAKRLVKHNDILISTVRPDQKHYGIIKEPIENLVVSTGFCVITCSDISTYFIYLLLTNDEMTEYLHSIAEGSTSTYPSLKPSDIENIEFLLPPRERLSDFDDIADNYFVKIKSNHDQIQTLTKIRDTLLPKLMSGEVRVKY